ncbi:hypothetical protein ACF0H5_006804 [Mactra antiquata]
MNRKYISLLSILSLCFISADEHLRSNCNLGYECDKCGRGRYKKIKILSDRVKVCCPNCTEYFLAGNKLVDKHVVPYCSCYSPDDIKGDCWKGEKCKTCLQSKNKDYVGSINSIPVCCQDCERSGLLIGPKICECLHNGP